MALLSISTCKVVVSNIGHEKCTSCFGPVDAAWQHRRVLLSTRPAGKCFCCKKASLQAVLHRGCQRLSFARAGMAFKSLTQQQRRAAAGARAQHRQGMRAALVRPAQSEGRQAAGRSSSALHASPTWSSSPASTQEKQHQYTCALLFE